jgi:serine/threonine protein kinase/Flp pilus assembly protein TadD
VSSLGQPTWIGQYRLTSRIATGGMAEVYIGRHIDAQGNFGPIVAVKKLLPHLVKDPSIVRMFLNEARITAQIQHPNVVKIFELGQVEGEPYIAMELLEGRTWADLRNRAAENARRMPMGVALYILTQACRGLDAAHKAKSEDGQPLALVHRDFTPDNIHVGVHGEVKVIDFGIAKTASWGAGTEPGTLKGKFFYMSPEMILAKPVDHRADVFAAGVMLYEQLCGRRPFTGTSVDEVVMKIATAKPTPPTTYDPAVPAPLEAICLAALNRNVESRFQSLEVFADAIEAIGGEAQLASAEEAGAYVTSLFPEKEDEQRQTLRRAREADPSHPGTRLPDAQGHAAEALANTMPTPHRVDAAREATRATDYLPSFEPAPVDTGREPPTQMERPPQDRPASLDPGELPQRSRAPIFIAVAVLLVLVVVSFLVFRGPAMSPAERLTLAEKAKPAERVELLEPIAKAPDATPEQLKQATTMLVADKAWDPALKLIDVWLVKDPKSLDARLLEAQAATAARFGKRAETAISKASELAPDDARPDAAFARLREQQGDASGALEGWTRAARKSRGTTEYLARQGYWLSQAGQLDEAEVALSKAHKAKPDDAATTAELGFVKFRKSKPDEALKLLNAAVKEAPQLMEAQYYLGSVLVQKGDKDGARKAFNAADALAGTDWRPLVALCEMEALGGESAPELAAVKKKLKERFPKEADSLISRCAVPPPPAE